MGEEWKNSKKQRETLHQMFDGKCGYCGEEMAKMQADHIEPITRLTTDAWGKPLPYSEHRFLKPELNVVGNMMPTCAPCNSSKGGYKLEEWRSMVERAHEIVAREKPIFKAGVRLGTICITGKPIIFHFEKVKGQADG